MNRFARNAKHITLVSFAVMPLLAAGLVHAQPTSSLPAAGSASGASVAASSGLPTVPASAPNSSTPAPPLASSSAARPTGSASALPIVLIGPPPGWARANRWDVELEGALGSTLGERHHGARFARARAGYLAARDESIYALTLSYEYANLTPHTFGVQAEYTNDNTGFWAQIGGLLDTHAHPGAMLAMGLTVVGAEVQYRRFDDSAAAFAVFAKLRIPIGIIAYEMK